jgi:hypothetical protein
VLPDQGGELVSIDGTVRVVLPPGLTTRPLHLRHRPLREHRRGHVHVDHAFRLEAFEAATGHKVSRFKAPLTIWATYSKDAVHRQGLADERLAIYWLDETADAWVPLPSTVDADRGVVTATVDHFTVFAIGGEAFETAGPTGNSFSDNFSDLNEWTIASGAADWSLGTNLLAAAGVTGTRDVIYVTNSSSYTDLTTQVAALDSNPRAGHHLGIVFRYQDASNYYYAWLANNNTVGLSKVQGGTTTILSSVGKALKAAQFNWLQVAATGISLVVSWAQDVSGSPDTYTQILSITDSTFTSGAIGLINEPDAGQTRAAQFQSFSVSISLPLSWGGITVSAGNPGLLWDATTGHGGTHSLQLFGSYSGDDGYSAQANTITANASETFTVSAWIKTSNVSTNAGNGAKVVLIENPSGTQTVLGPQTGTATWTQYSTRFTTGSTTTSLSVRAELVGSGKANFDDISLCGVPNISFAGGVTLTPSMDPRTGTAASGSTSASVQADYCTFTLSATAPSSPAFPTGALQASCDGQPAVALVSGSSVTVCSGRTGTTGTARSVAITYTLNSTWNLTAVSNSVAAVAWQVSEP